MVLHPFSPEDWVYLKTWKAGNPQDQLDPKWIGPYLVKLTTHSALQLQGITPWAHHTRVKIRPVPEEVTGAPVQRTCEPVTDLKLLFKRMHLPISNAADRLSSCPCHCCCLTWLLLFCETPSSGKHLCPCWI